MKVPRRVEIRRRDVFNKRAPEPLKPRRKRLLKPGLDALGHFIGPHDIERAFRYFFHAPHRRACASLIFD